MTFEAINLSQPKHYNHRGEVNMPLRGKLFHLHVHYLEREKELEYKQKQVMELYAHHMKLVEEDRKLHPEIYENDEYQVEGCTSLECHEAIDD